MRLEELRSIFARSLVDLRERISGAPRPSSLLVRNRKKAARGQKKRKR